MPKYVVRFYKEYMDQFVVEASSSDEAISLAEQYEGCAELPKTRAIFFTGLVEQTVSNERVGSGDTVVHFYREDGCYQNKDAIVKEYR